MTTLNILGNSYWKRLVCGSVKRFAPWASVHCTKIIETLKLTQANGYIYIEKYLTRGYVGILRKKTF